MTKTLYLMCSGETLFDVQGKLEGWCDTPLTERGCEQARAAGRSLLGVGSVRPDHFFCSTAERASDALELACEVAYGEVFAYERLKGLKSFNFGIYEGKDAFLAPAAPYGDFFVPFGGDAQAAFAERMRGCLLGLMGRAEVRVALVASHALACECFARSCPGCPSDVRADARAYLTFSFDETDKAFSYIDNPSR